MKFAQAEGGKWTITAFAEMSNESRGTDVTDGQIKVYSADTLEELKDEYRGTLDILSHKMPQARVRIITSADGNKITAKELNTFNAQYGNLTIDFSAKVHDRFLVLDNQEMYHIGASLKDAGKKLFGADIIHNPAIIRFVLDNSI